jgi:uncharacterized protein (TIGR02611 family)
MLLAPRDWFVANHPNGRVARGQNAGVDQVRVEARAIDRRRRPRWATRSPGMLALYRSGVALVGGVILAIGVVLIPYPGPGWLIIFAGLAVLATEFRWANRLLGFLRHRYDAWSGWLGRRHWIIRVLALLVTAAIVVATLWVLGAFSLVGGWLGKDWPWLRSPFFG